MTSPAHLALLQRCGLPQAWRGQPAWRQLDTGFDPLSEEAKSAHAAALPLKRLGTVDDMTSAFVFLAGDEAGYYCGQLLHPNGGEIMP